MINQMSLIQIRPIVFCLDGDMSYEADFVLATLADQASQSQSSQASTAAASERNTSGSTRPKQRAR